MIDIHCHILNGIDDGCKTIEDSLDILRQAEANNITDIILTPHYIKESVYNANNKKKKDLLKVLEKEVKKENINVNLYLGNEVYIDNDILDLLKKKEIMTLNNSKYILIELPMRNEERNTKNIIFNLIKNNYIPIIAHPERYLYIQDNINKIDEYLDLGVLLQGDYQSLFGKYGKHAEKTLKKLIKERKITFLASDIHKTKEDYNIVKLNKKLLKLTKKNTEEVYNLLEGNNKKIINNEEI